MLPGLREVLFKLAQRSTIEHLPGLGVNVAGTNLLQLLAPGIVGHALDQAAAGCCHHGSVQRMMQIAVGAHLE
ncbi:hypothetical protein D3C80_959410 [compost metagenome]